jgi:cell division protein ZapA
MAEVTVTIAGRTYRMACDEGQEAHLTGLGDQIDRKIADIRASYGDIGDLRLTVMAAIVIADELSAARRQLTAMSGGAEDDDAATDAAELINHLAERLEVLAADLRTRSRSAGN